MTRCLLGLVIGLIFVGSLTAADELRQAGETVIQFASLDEGREIVKADDSFTASLSPFDLQCRLKTSKDLTLTDWKQFVAQHVRPWEKVDIELVSQSLERLNKRLASFRLSLPPVIRLVRTTGEEESNASYTRASAIV